MPSFLSKVYFWLSLGFLISRTLGVSLSASSVYDESKKPLLALRTIPRNSWCIEAYRFSAEIINETVALSGMKLFHLTRELILTVSSNQKCQRVEMNELYFQVAGTIATYELVLLQINTDI